MKEEINIGEHLKKQTPQFVSGFMDALYVGIPRAICFNEKEYSAGYEEGTEYREKIDGGDKNENAR